MEDAAAYPLLTLPPAAQDNSRFTAAIIAALALHLAALVIGLYTPTTQRMGEETGSAEGMTVEIVDASELSSQAGQPPAQAPPKAEAPPSPPEPATPPQTAAQPAPDLKPSTHEEAPAPAPEPQVAAKSPPSPTALEDLDPSLFKIQPKAEAKPEPHSAAKQPKVAKPEKPAQLSMTVPTPSFTSSNDMSGRSAGISRPAGITRSGLNDEFGRGVIRALRQTMPPNNRIAQATVRFVLTADGNLLEVELVHSSGDPMLDKNVVFAVKQANFPIPATNLTALDRQFRVTYVYH